MVVMVGILNILILAVLCSAFTDSHQLVQHRTYEYLHIPGVIVIDKIQSLIMITVRNPYA
jgi:hypothetical protein